MIEIWIAFGTKKDLHYVPAYEISTSLTPHKSMALLMFHAFTSCDTVSHFAQGGEKTAWKVGKIHDDVTAAFYEFHRTTGRRE